MPCPATTEIDLDEQFDDFAQTMANDFTNNFGADLDALTNNDNLMKEVAHYWSLSWPPKTKAGREMFALLASSVLMTLTVGVLGAPQIILPLVTIGTLTKDTWRSSLKWSEGARKKIQSMNEEDQSGGN